MIVVLSNLDIIYDMDKVPNTIPDDANELFATHLTTEKRVIVLTAEWPAAGVHHLAESHVEYDITTNVNLYTDNGI